jgi:hypothetical protein
MNSLDCTGQASEKTNLEGISKCNVKVSVKKGDKISNSHRFRYQASNQKPCNDESLNTFRPLFKKKNEISLTANNLENKKHCLTKKVTKYSYTDAHDHLSNLCRRKKNDHLKKNPKNITELKSNNNVSNRAHKAKYVSRNSHNEMNIKSPMKEFLKITLKNQIISVFKETAKFNQTIKLKIKEEFDVCKSSSFAIYLNAIITNSTRDNLEEDFDKESKIKYTSMNFCNTNKNFGIETTRERAMLDLLLNVQNNDSQQISSNKGKTLKRPSINYAFINIASSEFSDTSFAKRAMIFPDEYFTHTNNPRKTHSSICTDDDSDSLGVPEIREFELLSNEFGSRNSIIKTIFYDFLPLNEDQRKKLGLVSAQRFRPSPSRCLVRKILSKRFND